MIEQLSNPWIWGVAYGLPLITVLMTIGAFATWWERRFSARMQNRHGPRWVGPQGLFQVIADGLKMMQKEDIVPREADRPLYRLAPVLPVFLVLATAAVIPFSGYWDEAGRWQAALVVADLDIGVLWVLALAGLMVFPIWMAGWASNNKYTLLAGMRAVAQGVSYEIPLVMVALVPVVATGTMSLSGIIAWQAENGWLVYRLPFIGALSFALFFLASLAEANRIPFDIPEAESELVGGVIVEYIGLQGGMFLMAEYLHTAVAAALATALFLGGSHFWMLPLPLYLGPVVFAIKAGSLFVLIYWIRWSWYRFRADQLMELCWVVFVPASLVLVMLTALQVWYEGLV